MTLQRLFYNRKMSACDPCSVIWVMNVWCIHAEYFPVPCQYKPSTLQLRLSQQHLWLTRASSISSLSLLRVHSCEWCRSAISGNTEGSDYLCRCCWPSHSHKHTHTNYKQAGRFEPERKRVRRQGGLRNKVERKWNRWWNRWRGTLSKQRIWKGKVTWIEDIH